MVFALRIEALRAIGSTLRRRPRPRRRFEAFGDPGLLAGWLG